MFNSPILYKKTLAGQREYKRSIPRFIAISEDGICIKWNASISPTEFTKEACSKLINYLEAGFIWDVCVLYKLDESYTRLRTFFKVEFTADDYIYWNKKLNQSKDFLDKYRHAIFSSCKRAWMHRTKTTGQFIDDLEKRLDKI